MSKALLITGVDFSDVALDQVTILEDKPCTAVSLSPSSLSFDTHEESKQLTAVKTPSDTTDMVTWTSSNTNVATVSGSGLVTIHGIGTATITATCGSATATLTINQTSLKQSRALFVQSGKYPEKRSTEEPIVQTGNATGNIIIAQAKNSDDTDLRMLTTSDCELIKVPYGATNVKVATKDSSSFSIYRTVIADVTQMTTVQGTAYPTWNRNAQDANSATGITVAYGECVAFRVAANTAGLDPENVDYVYFT